MAEIKRACICHCAPMPAIMCACAIHMFGLLAGMCRLLMVHATIQTRFGALVVYFCMCLRKVQRSSNGTTAYNIYDYNEEIFEVVILILVCRHSTIRIKQ